MYFDTRLYGYVFEVKKGKYTCYFVATFVNTINKLN